MQSKAVTVADYLAELPADRRKIVESVRKVVLENLDEGIEEIMQYGMIGYVIPHAIYPPGYHCTPEQPLPYAAIAAQKNHFGLYMMFLYGNEQEEAWFRERWRQSGQRLDMGKACVRFRSIEQVPLDVVAAVFRRSTIRRYLTAVEKALSGRTAARKSVKKTAKKVETTAAGGAEPGHASGKTTTRRSRALAKSAAKSEPTAGSGARLRKRK